MVYMKLKMIDKMDQENIDNSSELSAQEALMITSKAIQEKRITLAGIFLKIRKAAQGAETGFVFDMDEWFLTIEQILILKNLGYKIGPISSVAYNMWRISWK